MAQLGRFTHSSASSTTGLPASGASVTLYREGATVNGDQSGTTPLTVTVHHSGKIKASDTVFINTTTGTSYNVNSVTATTVVLSGFAGTLSLTDQDRLIPGNSKPTLYADDQGTNTTANPLTTSSVGLASCFMEFGAYDYIVSGGGLTTTKYVGMVSGSESPGQIRYADNFAANSTTGGIQEAVDDLPSAGGIVILSAKTYSTSAKIWLHTGCHLKGAGIGATVIQRASGSITDGSATASGNVVGAGPKGSNGTQFSSGTIGTDVSISDLTLDGNYSNFTSLTNTNLGLSALRILWVNGVHVHNVEAQNTLEDGFYFSNCNSLDVSNIRCDTVGQWSVTSSRNAISFMNNDNSSTYTNQGTLSGFYFKTVGDEGITIGGCQGLSVSNGSVDGADFGIEFTSTNTVGYTDLSFSNIVFRNLLSTCITIAPTAAVTVARCSFSNLVFQCHASTHNAGVIYMAGSTYDLADCQFNNIIATNINTTDTTACSWIDIQSASGKSRQRIRFSNLNFTGKSGSTRTADAGINMRHTCTDIFFDGVFFKNVAGYGISLDDATADTISNIHFNNVCVDTANYFGCSIRNNTAAATMKEIYFTDCVTKDCSLLAGGSNAGWTLIAGFAASTINNVYLRNCRSYRISDADHAYGIVLTQTAGTLGPVYLIDCDFSGCETGEISTSGTITLLQCSGRKYGTQSLTAVGNTLTLPSKIADCMLYIDSDGNYTLTSTPTIADGTFDGQRVTIMNVDATPNTFGLQDESGLAGSNIFLDTVAVGGTTFTLNQGDNITLAWSSALATWVTVAMQNGVA